MCWAPAPAMRSMKRPAAEACAWEALSGRRRLRSGLLSARLTIRPRGSLRSARASGSQAEDGAVEEDPAQELGLRHDLGHVVDREQAEIGAAPAAASATKSTSWNGACSAGPPTK